MKIKQFLVKKKFPKKLNRLHFASICVMKNKDYIIPFWDKNGRYISYEIDDIIPVLEKEGYKGFYKIVSIEFYTSSMSDTAEWDDRKDFDLVFDHLEKC